VSGSPVSGSPVIDAAPEGASRWPLVIAGLLLVALGLVPTGNLLSDGVVTPHWGRNVAQWTVWLVASSLLALVLARLGGARLRALLAAADRVLLAPSPRSFAVGAGVAVTVLAVAVGYVAFGLRPVSADERAQLWQARLLASGHLAARTPAHPEFFSTTMTVDAGGRWFTQFPIGGAAFLALGVLVGAPWLVNPLLTGLTAVAFYRFVGAIDGEQTARRATILFALSPFVLLMGGSQMNHVVVLAAVTTALASLARWTRADDDAAARRPAALIGLALGVAATSRPYDAVLAAIPIAIFQLVVLRRRPALRRTLVWQCAAGLAPVAILLACNWMTTGSPLLFGYDLLNGPEHRPGFHMSPLWVDHTAERGLRMASSYLMMLDTALLAWPVPAVLLIAATLLLQRRATRWDLLLLGILGTILVGYGAYWAESYFAGPRFLYVAVPVFILLVARFPLVVGERLHGQTARTAMALLVPLWVVLAWTLPPNRTHAYGVRTVLRLNAEKRSNTDVVARAPKDPATNVLVFVPEGWHGRLAARLRRVGTRPLSAERLVATADACLIQTTLDELESAPDPGGDRTRRAIGALLRDTGAVAQPQLRASDEIVVSRTRPLTPACVAERARADSYGVSIAELLTTMSVDRSGSLAGDVIYARDLGAADERLRAEFGARHWLVARITETGGGVQVRFEPYASPAATADAQR
jgi:hypothetical protein